MSQPIICYVILILIFKTIYHKMWWSHDHHLQTEEVKPHIKILEKRREKNERKNRSVVWADIKLNITVWVWVSFVTISFWLMKPEKEQNFVTLQKGNDRLGWIHRAGWGKWLKSWVSNNPRVYDGGGVEKCYPVDMAF